MSQASTLVLIPESTKAGASIQTIVGENQKAASYEVAWRDSQTISWSALKTFDGTITIQASLVEAPTATDWVDVLVLPTEAGTQPGLQSGWANIRGCYVWIRAVVRDWSVGNIQAVTMSY
jgi:hypothetical protein